MRLPAATTEAPAVDRLRVGAWLALGGLALAALPLPAAMPLQAQEAAGEEALTERFRQTQGPFTPGAAQPAPDAAPSEQALTVRRDLQPEASADTGPLLGEDEVRSLLREGLGVEILSIEAIESEGRAAYAVTVMSPPGNDNSAFAVETLLIDGATGGVLGRVPQTPRVAAPERWGPSDPESSGLEIRRRTYR